jgi:hypothetical protein
MLTMPLEERIPMAQRSRPTSNKRQREQARVAKQKAKEARRLEKSRQDREAPRANGAVDPDIAHIQPGPQPPADWQMEDDE